LHIIAHDIPNFGVSWLAELIVLIVKVPGFLIVR
jgi:hypothetical protein